MTARWTVVGLILANLVLAWWIARSIGRIWVEARNASWLWNLVLWPGALISAGGFTLSYFVVVFFGTVYVGWFPFSNIGLMVDPLLYVLVIAALFGLVTLTFRPWRRHYQEVTLARMPSSQWDDFVTMYAGYYVADSIFDSMGHVSGGFGGDFSDGGDAGAWIMIIVVGIFCLFAGIATTAIIITHNAASEDIGTIASRIGRPAYRYN